MKRKRQQIAMLKVVVVFMFGSIPLFMAAIMIPDGTVKVLLLTVCALLSIVITTVFESKCILKLKTYHKKKTSVQN